MKTARLILPVLVGLFLATIVLLGAVRQSSAALQEPAAFIGLANADRPGTSGPQTAVRYVATSGVDAGGCTDSSSPCRTVQYAVHVAVTGDEVRVSAGLYNESVVITETITLQGGYTLTDWTEPDPDANPTILDAQGSGNVIFITGGVTPTLSGFQIMHGQPHGIEISNASPVVQDNLISDNTASGVYLGSWPTGTSSARIEGNLIRDNGQGMEIYFSAAAVYSNTFEGNGPAAEGGGLYVLSSQAEVLGNTFDGNLAGNGGAVFVRESAITLRRNVLTSNHADYVGGAVYILLCSPILEANQVISNTAVNSGAGISVIDGSPTITNNKISGNRGADYGGGVDLLRSDAAVISNTLQENESRQAGGGLFSSGGNPQILNNRIKDNHSVHAGGLALTGLDITPAFAGNRVEDNRADSDAGGIYLEGLLPASLIANNMIINNQANTSGSGMFVTRSFASLVHNTIVGDQSGENTGVYVGGYYPSELGLLNTILVSHTVGIQVENGSSAQMDGTLWGSGAWANGQDWAGDGAILTGTVNVWDDPSFIDPANGDYHISPASAAVDAGVDAGLTTDIDGEPRPLGAGFDIGADEIQQGDGVRYVATSGVDAGDCTNPASPCRTVQYAVDVAGTGNEVRVAAGTYTDIHVRPRQDITTTGTVTQVVYISKTLSIQGGYTLANWTEPDPDANPTILDAGGQGRVVYIAGDISPTITGLHITGGDATDQGGIDFPFGWHEQDAGGGVYLYQAAAVIISNQIYSNTSPRWGGGIHLAYSTAVLQDNLFTGNSGFVGDGGGLSSYGGNNQIITNTFVANQAFDGGAIFITYGTDTVRNNHIYSNSANSYGGAIFLDNAPANLMNNQIFTNTAGSYGGGITAMDSDAIISGNFISWNTADNGGGGLELFSSNAVLEGNEITHNTAQQVGGIRIDGLSPQLTNNMIADNFGTYNGSGLTIASSAPNNPVRLLHNTFSRNGGDIGAGLLMYYDTQAILTNTIFVSQSVGIYSCGDVSLKGTLWGSGEWANGMDWYSCPGALLTPTLNVWGDPGFIDPENGNYHIGSTSAAVDAGVDAGVTIDIDGEPRPLGAGFDIGADEVQQGEVVRYVATSGVDAGDCTDPASPCRTVQFAVDAAGTGDEVRVAAGVYTDTVYHYQTTYTVYISKTIDLQGGYTLTNWTSPEPELNPTILAAPNSQDWVVGINRNITDTVTGFHITGGSDGGIRIWVATVVIRDNQLYGNYGSALDISASDAMILENHIHDNGSGVHADLFSHLIIENNIIEENQSGIYMVDYGEGVIASNVISGNQHYGIHINITYALITGNLIISNGGDGGGGINLYDIDNPVIIENNTILGNSTAYDGGGIKAYQCVPIIRNNYIAGNTAHVGGGLSLQISWFAPAIISGNIIISNSAQYDGGGVFLHDFYDNWLPPGMEHLFINNIISDNYAGRNGSGAHIADSNLIMTHNTITGNHGGDGSGVLIDSYYEYPYSSVITLSNNIIVSHTVGITVGLGSTATLEGTLWGSGDWANGQDWAGGGAITTGTVNVWGDPGFIDPEDGDYHITSTSAAIDAGVDAGITTDIDGEPRPLGGGFDIGADEVQVDLNVTQIASADPVASGDLLTYTLRLTNTGVVDLHATITDLLPASGGTWMQTVSATVDPDYAGPLTNTLQATSLEGADGVAVSRITAIQPISGLAVYNDSPSLLGEATHFTSTLEGGSGVAFTWDFGDGEVGFGQVITHTYPGVGIYTATVTAGNPVSSLAAQTTVTVEEAITGLSAATSSPTILGEATAFTATVTGGSNVVFTWDFGDGDSGIGQVITHTYPGVGVYTATVTAGNPVSSLVGQTTVIVEEAISGLSADSSSPTTLGEATAFTATVTGGSNVVFTWDFGDGSTDAGAGATHTYAAAGVYTATATGSNLVSVQSVSTTIWVVQPEFRLFLPLVQNDIIQHSPFILRWETYQRE